MLFDNQEMKTIIFEDEEKLALIFSQRDDTFLQNFNIFIEVLNKVKDIEIPWKVYKIFKESKSLLTTEEIHHINEKITQIHKVFGDLSLEEIELNILRSLFEGDIDDLIDCETDIENYLFGLQLFPDKLIEILTNLLTNKNFLQANGSWHILKLLHHECEKISSQQWNYLLPQIENSFSKFKDWMSCFILTEIIGEDFPTSESFVVLMRLKNTENEICRSYIPNALEGFIRNSHDPRIKKEAYNSLTNMKDDKSAIVAKEAIKSYEAIKYDDD
jgi:hypothetical protein